MTALRVHGGQVLSGVVRNAGSKNASLPMLAASTLIEGESVFLNVPTCSDVRDMLEILRTLGAQVRTEEGNVFVDCSSLQAGAVVGSAAERIRASFLLAGALLARHGRALLAPPGGCRIGARPVDLHLKGFEAMGAAWQVRSDGLIEVSSDGLRGANLNLRFPSVGATQNLMMAATQAEGATTICNAAREPEVVELASFLTNAGARIRGAGTQTLIVEGPTQFSGGFRHRVSPDRINAATFLAMGLACGSDLVVENVNPSHMRSVLETLEEMGAEVNKGPSRFRVEATRLRAVDIVTGPYPAFPSDFQPIVTVLLAVSDGVGRVTEAMFDDRLRHADELRKMGARIAREGRTLQVQGGRLSPARVEASDLRCAAALLVAALCAEGETVIEGAQAILRGYPALESTVRDIGGTIEWLR